MFYAPKKHDRHLIVAVCILLLLIAVSGYQLLIQCELIVQHELILVGMPTYEQGSVKNITCSGVYSCSVLACEHKSLYIPSSYECSTTIDGFVDRSRSERGYYRDYFRMLTVGKALVVAEAATIFLLIIAATVSKNVLVLTSVDLLALTTNVASIGMQTLSSLSILLDKHRMLHTSEFDSDLTDLSMMFSLMFLVMKFIASLISHYVVSRISRRDKSYSDNTIVEFSIPPGSETIMLTRQ